MAKFKLRTAIYASFLIILCQCAVKHQPKIYTAYFSDGYSTKKEREQRAEREQLESGLVGLTLLQKKRLFDLYDAELSRLRLGDPLRSDLEQKMGGLQAEVTSLMETPESTTISSEKNGKSAIKDFPWSAKIKKIKDLWNKDENEKALKALQEVLTEAFSSTETDNDEKYKLSLLKFRIQQDNLASPELLVSYERLRELGECRPETTQAGFVVALSAYLNGKNQEALTLFEKQCDEDKSLSNKLRRLYWVFQFQTDPVKKEEAYTRLMSLPVYGYYQYLAKVKHGEDYLIPLGNEAPELKEIVVPRSVANNLEEAEKRIEGNLKKDAQPYLTKASDNLKNEPDENLEALLYVLSLFQASGNHLEAVRLYGNMQATFQKDTSFERMNRQWTYLFPRPFAGTVDWVAKQWGVEKNFVWSIMRQESAFNAFATSSADARGLMQLMPFLAKEMSVAWRYRSSFRDKGMYSTEENIKLGAFHLHQLFKFLEHPALVAAAYNAGIQRIGRWTKRMGTLPLDVFVELIPINETRNYVKLVLRNYIHYHAMENKGLVGKQFIPLRLPAASLP